MTNLIETTLPLVTYTVARDFTSRTQKLWFVFADGELMTEDMPTFETKDEAVAFVKTYYDSTFGGK